MQDLQELLSVHRIYPEFTETIEPKVSSKEVEDSLAESQKEVRIKIIVLVGNKTGKTEELTEGLSMALELLLRGWLLCVRIRPGLLPCSNGKNSLHKYQMTC